ncbi:GLPGLI family protein [Epilithonimonas hispanica]|uniref:GLPGLI family protein n=1 Tax=Epilithonimonas hispanica TaxID=358687 RepID=A0A3D9CZG7_9FLAO|nr:GLPGLI family protein [Epilithonimonas hispanica]REC71175.1 hypothetical protein DRF58_06485 [Epilithonimonas hispanica]
MKKIFFILSFLIYFQYYGQYNVYYSLEKKIESKKLLAEGLLQLNIKENRSIFYLSQYKNLLKNKFEINELGDTIKVLKNSSICQDKKEYFFNFNKKISKLLLYDVDCNSKSLINQKITLPNWKINPKLKKYKQWNVYEATAFINDRKWDVLFTKDYNDINVFGPWLLVGLPGLVVQASDEMNVYFFELEKVEKSTSIILSEPDFSKKLDFLDYKQQAITSNKKRIVKKIAAEFNIPEKDVDISNSPNYETLDFIEK